MGTIYLNKAVFNGTGNEAIAAADNGGLIEFEGAFNEQLKTSRQFDPDNRLRILGHDAVFDGTSIDTATKEEGIVQINGGGLVIENLETRNAFRGVSLYGVRAVDVVNCYAHTLINRAIGGSGKDIVIRGNRVRNAVLENENNKKGSGGWAGAVATWDESGAPSENVKIINNVVTDSWGEGIMALRGNNYEITGNIVRDCWSVLMYFNKVGHVVAHSNLLQMTKDEFKRPRGGQSGSYGVNFSNESASGDALPMVNNVSFYNNWILDTYRAVGNWHKSTANARDTYHNMSFTGNYIGAVSDCVLKLDSYPSPYPYPKDNEWGNNYILSGAPSHIEIPSGMGAAWSFSDDIFVDALPPYGSAPTEPPTTPPPLPTDPAQEQLDALRSELASIRADVDQLKAQSSDMSMELSDLTAQFLKLIDWKNRPL